MPARRALLTLAATVPLALGLLAAPATASPATGPDATPAAQTAGAGAGIASPPGTKKVTATLFQWRFADVARECTNVLGPKGYGFVEVSPATEHIQGSQWWTSYQPVSYRIAGRLGDRAAFQNMVATCHAAGVKVIADAVINHMSAGSGTGTGGSPYTKYDYPGTYQNQDFHSCRQPISNYGDRWQVQNCELVGLSDLDTGASYVRNRIADYIDDLASLGVDGFRIDGAKHVAAADMAAIKALTANPSAFWVHEVIWAAGEPVQPSEYTGSGDVDEFRYAFDLKRVFAGEKLAYLSNFGQSWGFLPDAQARPFVDNWDTERNGSTLNRTYGSTYTLANVFMLAWPYGAPNVYSGYEFTNYDAGPPNNGAVTACYQNGWTCQHAWPQIANMVGFRNTVGSAPVANWWSNGNNAISFSRGSAGHVVINRETSPITQTFQTSLPAGRYCDVQHGDPSQGCRGGHVYTVGSDGRFAATVGAGDAIALHTGARPASGALFSVNATTSFGQNVFVVGSTAALGAWNTAAAVPLSSAAYPAWRLGVGAAGGTFQYKYIRKDAGGAVTWESGANRTATVPANGFVTLDDTWRP